ncbi:MULTISPECIES: factor-independent urate hydroxylase [unclassified Spirosoma]|uniref:factor-independent urate hydroxylase n=1 Tax=unclassified Spirosoma TaxID=2621999 RepID=UPI000966007A|nr:MULTISPECIES: urate oxidase [unclassified Spirosoma]MBN8825591.1 urate oxidase [Spirosoma sp.]OJW71704.1 MAG: urate oxidase [Spirosoma sp. 48-14]
MKTILKENAYGKNAVNLSKIIRHPIYHEFRQIAVNISLQGDFETAHTLGDNSKILPTDTQKNTVYALAKEHFTDSIEHFALYLANYFLANNTQVSQATVDIIEFPWTQMAFDGDRHAHAYLGGNSEKHTTTVIQTRSAVTVTAGLKDLLILKTTDSGFEGYIKDQFTTLKETADRIFATQCEASWTYTQQELDFTALFKKIREILLKTFAHHKSLSVQQTLLAMGEAVLNETPEVSEISLKLPNKHHILFNLEQFGMENKNEIFIATDEPYGYITGTMTRE